MAHDLDVRHGGHIGGQYIAAWCSCGGFRATLRDESLVYAEKVIRRWHQDHLFETARG